MLSLACHFERQREEGDGVPVDTWLSENEREKLEAGGGHRADADRQRSPENHKGVPVTSGGHAALSQPRGGASTSSGW